MGSAIIIILKSLFTVYYGIGIIYQYKFLSSITLERQRDKTPC